MWSGGVFEALFLENSTISDDILFNQVLSLHIKNVLIDKLRDIIGRISQNGGVNGSKKCYKNNDFLKFF